MVSNYPLQMSKKDRERDYTLELCPPPELSYKFTQNSDENNMNSNDVKDLKAEEKRGYELENCKIAAITEENREVIAEQREKEQVSKNPLDVSSKQLEHISDIFDISNSQMF